MYEMLPVVAGVLLGAAILHWGPAESRGRVVLSLVAALVVGFIAASASGEISESPLFVLVDAAFMLIATAVALWGLPKLGWNAERRNS